MSSNTGKSKRTLGDAGGLSHPFITLDESLACGRGMTDCMVVGISGECGETCPVFKLGNCEEPQDIYDPDGIYHEHTYLFTWMGEEVYSPVMQGLVWNHYTIKKCSKCGHTEWPD